MKIKLKLQAENKYPKIGFIIFNPRPQHWMAEIQQLGLDFKNLEAYALPGLIANSVSGCLVIPHAIKSSLDIGKNVWMRKAHKLFFISEFRDIYPRMSDQEVSKLLGNKVTILHPEIGFFQLEEAICWEELISMNMDHAEVIIPEDPIAIPTQIKAMLLKAPDPESSIEEMMKKEVPKNKKLETEPLNILEKLKLSFYKSVFKKQANSENALSNEAEGSDSLLAGSKGGRLFGFFSRLFQKPMEQMRHDMENLEERNKKELEKLLEMMRNDPANALMYALPLDEAGLSRGNADISEGLFKMTRFFNSFDLNTSARRVGGGGSINIGDQYQVLQEQYNATAKELIKLKDYKKAAFVYLKLLKNSRQAAETLIEGGYYGEAAALYIKELNDLPKAAECYEKGRMYLESLELYKKLNNFAKAGDLHTLINQPKEAVKCYQEAVEQYVERHDYLNAGVFAASKLADIEQAQELYLQGWKTNSKGKLCLSAYFNLIKNDDLLSRKVRSLSQDLSPSAKVKLTQVLIDQIDKRKNPEELKDLSYELLSEGLQNNVAVLDLLNKLEPKNREIGKDTYRFKLNKRRV